MTDAAPHTPLSGTLTLRTLGDAGLYADATSAPLLGPGKSLALLVYLALSPGRRTSREFLLDLLWADLDPDRARRALRQAVFYLRRLLGDDVLAGNEELILARELTVDRDLLLSRLEAGDQEEAVALYLGDFLPSFGVPGGAGFEQWADLERHRLRTTFLRSADILVRRYLNQSRFKEGQRFARRVRDLVPESEAAWRLVLESTIAGQDFVAAAVEAEAFERQLEAEGAPMEAATRSVLARARGLSPSGEAANGSQGLLTELTGREREFSTITSAWEHSRVGRSRHLHLSAPAGFGKSRLLRDACTRLAAGGAKVVRLQPKTGDREVPYSFAGDLALAIASLPGSAGIAPASAAALVGLNPALSSQFAAPADSARGEEALRRRIHSLVDLIQSVAHEQPFVLAIDDLHWIDQPSLRVLEGVFSRLDSVRLLCLTAARPERQPSDEQCIRLPLSALTPDQLASLVSALGALPSGERWSESFIGGLHRATGGSPLLVLETVRLAIDQGILALDRNEWRCLKEVRLHSLLQAGEALRERVRGLPQAQSWLLAVLAVAGTPIETDTLASVADLTPPDCTRHILALEQLGLVVGTTSGWVPAHDEIAAASRESLRDDLRQTAHRAIGRLQGRSDDADSLLRAARHFIAAGDDGAVQGLHRRYARIARGRGDRRGYDEIAAELVGEETGTVRVRTLTGALPLSWRIGLWSTARQLTAAVVVLALPLITFAVANARRAEAATLQRLIYADSLGNVASIAIQPSTWSASSTGLLPSKDRSAMASAATTYAETAPAISPDGESVAWIQDSGDSTTLDIWIRTAAGTRRLTNSVGDDLVRDWLPDGSAIVGTTNRWSPADNRNYDIAIFDTATGIPRQVTHGPEQDNSPYVSPDGTRIAFIRAGEDAPPMLCVTTVDGQQGPHCRLIDGKPIRWLLGWAGLDEMVLTTDGLGQQPLVLYDWQRDVVTTLLGPQAYRPRLSPDRRWALASVRLNGAGGAHDMVVPLSNPGQARPVDGPGRNRTAVRWWEGRPDQSKLIDRLVFSDSVHEIRSGIGTRLTVRPVTASGLEIPMRTPIMWRSSDSTIASVDSVGEVRVHTDGEVVITASLSGWRSINKSIKVVDKPPVILLDEHWDATWLTRWLPWGDPAPTVTAGPDGTHTFWNRGDGSYPSMGVSRQAFSGKDGLGLEVRVATPLGDEQHQRVEVALVADVNFPALEAADQKKAPPSLGNPDLRCGIIFPGGNRWSANQLAVTGGIAVAIDLAAAAKPLRTGAWWTLRLQLMPDGRCGVAINRKVIWVSPDPVPPTGSYRVWLGSESVGAKLLHGPLQVWTGVRTDIRWTATSK